MDYKTIRIDIRERVGVITLDYPPYNSVSKRMIAEIIAAIGALEADDAVRCIMLRAEGPDFSYGADSGDIKYELGAASEITESYSVLGNRLVESIDGERCDDLSPEGLTKTLAALGGALRKDIAEAYASVKKKK